ncbi:MAG: M1 family metallopeptidase, partial [Thermoanaerobaculia bacterium]
MLLLAIPLSAARLGERVVPKRYVLQVTPDLSRETFAGEESIDLQIGEPVTTLRLHALDLALSAATLLVGGETMALTVSPEPVSETVMLDAGRLIPAGPARLQLHFEGKLNQELRGFYVSRTEKRKYAVTQFEATDARRAFPCFDEPSFKAVYEISLVIDSRDSAISNAQMISDTPGRRGKHTVRFAPTPPISSYLVAMLVGDFRCLKGSSDDIPIRVCTTPGQERLARFALDTAQAVLHYDNVYFGIRYPFAKLDLIGIPDFQAGAMENAGAITFRESFLLLDDATASTEDRKLVAGVIAHEIAHMWFGDLVTMKWWDDIWLNEGFATLMTRRPLEAWHPEWRLDLDAVNQTLAALATDSRQSTRKIRTGVETPREIFSLFDGIAYGKTASVLGMIEEWLGPEVFRKSISQYLTRYAWNNASAEDFWSSMAQSSGQPVDTVMRSFVEQPGAPLLHITERCEGEQRLLEVSQ